MTFNPGEPQDTTKIRNLGTVIRPNFLTILEGHTSFKPYAINLQNRTPLVVSNDPANIAGSTQYYTKNDGGGVAEGHIRPPAGSIIQLTDAGRIGGPTQGFQMQNIQFNGANINYGRNQVVSAYAKWDLNGDLLGPAFRCSVSRTSVGRYQISLTGARTSVNYIVNATPTATASIIRVSASVQPVSTTVFTVFISRTGTSNDLVDLGGYCMVVGGF